MIIEATVGRMDDKCEIEVEYKEYERVYRPHSVLITHNGYQWSGFSLSNIDEVVGLHEALGDYIDLYRSENP